MGTDKDAARPKKDTPGPETAAPEPPTSAPKPGNDGIRISTDAMIALVVTEAEERECAGLPSLREMNDAFQPSEAFEKKMEKLRRTVKNRQKLRRWLRAAKRMVVCLTVLVTLLTCAMVPAKAVREAVIEIWLEWHDQCMSILYFSENAEVKLLPETIELAYIPDGFTPEEPAVHNAYSFIAGYANGEEFLHVYIAAMEGGAKVSIDNEYTAFYTVRFQDHDAIWAAHEDGMNTLVWNNRNDLFQISGTVDLRTLIQVAENIKMSN